MMKGKRRSDIISKQNINPSKEFTLFYIWRWCQILRKYGTSKIWPWKFIAKVTGKVSGQGHTWNKSTYLCILLLFRANRTMHSKDIGNLSFDLEISSKYSKYGVDTYISIYFFFFSPYFNVKFTMKRSGHLWAYFSTKIVSNFHKCLASNPKSYFTLYKRHFELKHNHYYGNLSHLVRYLFLVIVRLGCKFEVFSHSYKLPDNYW